MSLESKNSEGISEKNKKAEQINEGRRNIAKLFGSGAALYALHGALRLFDDKTANDKSVDDGTGEKTKSNCSNGEICETFMGVELKRITPRHTEKNLPPLQRELKEKPGAKYDPNTGNVVYGNAANYIIDEPLVEFKHTLMESGKTHEGNLLLKISAAKALIKAERELGEKIPVKEGLRTNDTQRLWYERNNCMGKFDTKGCEKRPYPTAPEGLSEHEIGQAIDIDTSNRPKYKKVLLKYGFLDNATNDPPHFTYKTSFTEAERAISDKNDEYYNSPGYKKWYMRETHKMGKFLKKNIKKIGEFYRSIF